MWDYGNHMSGWGWAFMGVSAVLVWALIVTGIVLLVQYLSRSNRHEDSTVGSANATEILARRFARGEISEEEFLAKAKLIKH